MYKFLLRAGAAAGLLVPMMALAQLDTTEGNTQAITIVGQATGIIRQIIPFLIALAVLFFLWGLVRFMFSAGNEDAAAEGKRIMLWGIIILFVMVSIWGLVGILNQFTGVSNTAATPSGPGLPGANVGTS